MGDSAGFRGAAIGQSRIGAMEIGPKNQHPIREFRVAASTTRSGRRSRISRRDYEGRLHARPPLDATDAAAKVGGGSAGWERRGWKLRIKESMRQAQSTRNFP